jgi:hypothetical protein
MLGVSERRQFPPLIWLELLQEVKFNKKLNCCIWSRGWRHFITFFSIQKISSCRSLKGSRAESGVGYKDSVDGRWGLSVYGSWTIISKSLQTQFEILPIASSSHRARNEYYTDFGLQYMARYALCNTWGLFCRGCSDKKGINLFHPSRDWQWATLCNLIIFHICFPNKIRLPTRRKALGFFQSRLDVMSPCLKSVISQSKPLHDVATAKACTLIFSTTDALVS